MSEDHDWHYYYHPEDIPGYDELPPAPWDDEDIWNEMLRAEFQEDY